MTDAPVSTLTEFEAPPRIQGGEWLTRHRRVSDAAEAIRRRVPRLEVLATSVVHPRHPLPAAHLRLVSEEAAGRRPDIPTLGELARTWARGLAFAARDTARIAWLRLRFGRALARHARRPARVVLKTWAFGAASAAGPADFYYGTLPQQLEALGVSCVVLCGDGHGGLSPALAAAVLGRGHVRSVPEPLLVPLWAPLALMVRQLGTSLRLRRLARHSRDTAQARVAAEAARECAGPHTMRNALYYYIARAAVRRWRPQALVTLYEGQPWEQPAWHGALAGDARCRLIGYQHSVVLPHSRALLAPQRGAWQRAPDVVLCLGEVTRRLLAPGHAPAGSTVLAFGSFRRSAQAPVSAPEPARRALLVLPEGIPSEAALLYDVALRLAEALPGWRVILRCHPVLPFDRVLPRLWRQPEALPNVELSGRAGVEEDFARTCAVLYRGSSAVLYAVLRGLKPFYWHADGVPDVDPLSELSGWPEAAASVQELARALRQYADTPASLAQAAWETARDYAQAYAPPVDGRAVQRFLSAAGLGGEGGA